MDRLILIIDSGHKSKEPSQTHLGINEKFTEMTESSFKSVGSPLKHVDQQMKRISKYSHLQTKGGSPSRPQICIKDTYLKDCFDTLSPFQDSLGRRVMLAIDFDKYVS